MADASQLRARYTAFYERDIDALLEALADDVDWPNAWEGGRLQGREAVRGYWIRQWDAIDPRVDPVAIQERPDGRVAVEVEQVVRDLDGGVLSEGPVLHVYELRGPLVTRMDVEEVGPGESSP